MAINCLPEEPFDWSMTSEITYYWFRKDGSALPMHLIENVYSETLRLKVIRKLRFLLIFFFFFIFTLFHILFHIFILSVIFKIISADEMTKAFTASVMIFIEQFQARWPWSIGILES